MKMELQILDWIQQMRTPVGDIWMVFISRLGNAGMIWILFTCLLLMIPRTRRWGAALAAALCLDAIICNILLKPMVCRIRPCDVNQTVQLLIARPADYSFRRDIRRLRLLRSRLCILPGRKNGGKSRCLGDPDGVFKNVFICALPDRCFGRHDCGMRGGVFWKPAGGASIGSLETEDEKTRGQKK